MKNKAGAVMIVCISALLAFALNGCGVFSDPPPVPDDDEIIVRITLDLKQDIGLLLTDHTVDGHKGGGGMSNADRTMIKRDDVLYWSFKKSEYGITEDKADLTLKFTVVTEYFEPNYENIYPEECLVPMNEIHFTAEFGKIYDAVITGSSENGYSARLSGLPR